jgi:hypothetical protein
MKMIVYWDKVTSAMFNQSLTTDMAWISQDSDDYPQWDHNPTPCLQILFMSLEKAICSIEDEVGSGEGMDGEMWGMGD